MSYRPNHLKIINDPIYGLIQLPSERIFKLIEHPYFQRLRRIRQLGMTHLVYPGAHHTRFHHAIGAMHLMGLAVDVLRSKGHDISAEEAEGVTMAILLHDIGHGPFSHALENSIVQGVHHESISTLFMDRLNHDLEGALEMALSIFKGTYKKKFLHQLVSSQLDMDRLDYLNRDSFFTGVSEGVISFDRILKMLEVKDDQLVIEEKGIYSIEKFIVARRLMYWQVYLHKTVVSAECLITAVLRRAKELAREGVDLFSTPALKSFLNQEVTLEDFIHHPRFLDDFAELDDSDISISVKQWSKHPDPVLSDLSYRMLHRRLFRIQLQSVPFTESDLEQVRQKLSSDMGIQSQHLAYYCISGSIVNNAYSNQDDRIRILMKDGRVLDIADATDTLNIKALSETVEKYFLCYPKPN